MYPKDISFMQSATPSVIHNLVTLLFLISNRLIKNWAIENVISDSIVHVDCIGVKASYTVTKALIQVTEYLVENCYKFNMRPYYIKVQVNGQDEEQKIKTAIRWTLIAKKK